MKSIDAVALFNPIGTFENLKIAAKELGFKVVGVFNQSQDFFKKEYHLEPENLFKNCDEVIQEVTFSKVLEKLKDSRFNIRAAIAGPEDTVELADQTGHFLGLFCNRFELIDSRRDKAVMRKVLKESGLPCPDFANCKNEQDVKEFVKQHPFPLMIKTPKGAMTSQVYKCGDLHTILTHFHEIFGSKDLYGNLCDHVVVEEFINGKEYVVNSFSDGEKVHITDVWVYDRVQNEYFDNIYYNTIQLPLSDPILKPMINYALKLPPIFGIERGASHMEIMLSPQKGPLLLEIGARLAGIRMPLLLKECSNFDPFKATINVFVNGKTTFPEKLIYTKDFAIASCSLAIGGKVKKILGIEEIKKLPSYDFHILAIKVGEEVKPTTHLGTIPLHVYLAHKNREQLLQDVAKAHQLFQVEFF